MRLCELVELAAAATLDGLLLFFFVLCVILFFCILSICNSYNYYMHMFRRPALVVYSFWYSLPLYCFSLQLLFFLFWLIKYLSIYLSIYLCLRPDQTRPTIDEFRLGPSRLPLWVTDRRYHGRLQHQSNEV